MALTDFQILQHGPGQEDAPWPFDAQLYFARQVEKDAVAEYSQAIDFLAGLHPCLIIDGPPLAVAERIFDAVTAERADLKAKIARQEQALEGLRQALARARLGPPSAPQQQHAGARDVDHPV